MALIVTEQLTRMYGSRRGIDDVNLSIPEGSLYGFLGPNGAGKTTTIRVLLGFLRPTHGAARMMGMDCWRESAVIKREVGYVPGDLRLWPWMSGRSAIKLFGTIRGRDLRAAGERLAEAFELDMSVKVRAMSRGMRQKLGLVLAMAHDPKVLVLDEPSSALDPLMQDRLRDLLRAAAARGTTVFFSSHTLGEVEALCERVAIVRAGMIVADSTLDELRRQARQEVEIVWRDDVGMRVDVPRFVHLVERTERRWAGHVDDAALGELIGFLNGKPIADLRIARPDLETIFRRFYDEEDGASAGGSAVEGNTHRSSTGGTPVLPGPSGPSRPGDRP